MAIRWDPFADMSRLRSQINRIFEEAMGRPERGEPASSRTWAPAVDIYETDEAPIVQAELAGMRREDFDIELTGDTLTIRGDRQLEDGRRFLRVERPRGPSPSGHRRIRPRCGPPTRTDCCRSCCRRPTRPSPSK